jgi:hypothetical protein
MTTIRGRAMMRTILISAMALLLTTGAYAQSMNQQPEVPHAYYGRDGFWHCDPGYAAGESGGCELVGNPQLLSAAGRLRELEMSERVNASVRMRAR